MLRITTPGDVSVKHCCSSKGIHVSGVSLKTNHPYFVWSMTFYVIGLQFMAIAGEVVLASRQPVGLLRRKPCSTFMPVVSA